MKKLSIFLLTLLAIIIFLPRNNTEKTYPTDDYAQDYSFDFISVYKDIDPFYTPKIRSMIDQEYENYQIYLIINEDNSHIIGEIQTYAKKKNKGHLLHIISHRGSIPIPILLKNEIDKVHKDNILVFLDERCVLTSIDILSELNSIYINAKSKALVYTNHTNFPSLQKNTEEVTYLSSAFKTFYAEDIQNQPLESFEQIKEFNDFLVNSLPSSATTHLINESLYLLAR